MDRVKNKLKRIIASRTQGAMLRSKARWYEFGEKKSKHFNNLEKRNHKKKQITSLIIKNDTILSDPKLILEEKADFYETIFQSPKDSELYCLFLKKTKNLEFLKNWRPITLLNTDYKIATKAIAMRLEKVLPKIIHPCQAGYIRGRYIGECIRAISDIMSFTKEKNLPGAAVFLDFEKAFDSIEYNYLQFRQWVKIFYNDISSCVLNNGFAEA